MKAAPSGREEAIDLLLVGYRPGALRAASRMGLRTLVIDEREPGAAPRRRAAGWLRMPPDADPPDVFSALEASLGGAPPDRILAAGERGVILAAALRDMYGLKGVDPETAERVRDKAKMKAAVRAAGLRCADWLPLREDARGEEITQRLGVPVVLKHRAGAGSRGLTVAGTLPELEAFLAGLSPEDHRAWMAERMVHGVEMSVESFVQDGVIRFTNPTEYLVPAFANIAPAALPEEELEAVLDLNARALRALGIPRGMTHLELFRTPDGPVFGEVAVRPPGGRIMRLLRRTYHFDPWEAVLTIEGGGRFDFPERAIEASGVWMLHPGEGRVSHVRGIAAARRVPGVCKLVCRVRAGMEIGRRESTGADVGWIEVRGANRHQVAERLNVAHELLRIEMVGSGS